MVRQTSRGLEVEAEVAWGRPGFCGSAIHGGAGTKLPNIEMRPGRTKPQNKTIFVTEAAGWARKIEARRLCGRRAISTKVLGIRIQPADSR